MSLGIASSWLRQLDRARLAVIGSFLLLLMTMFYVRERYFLPDAGYVRVPPAAFSGDEPHYLVIVNSLLFDGDLNLSDDYLRILRGGFEAGARFRGAPLDHHTFLVNDSTRESAHWGKVFQLWSRQPCPPNEPCVGLRRTAYDFDLSSSVREAACHPVAFPMLLAATIAPRAPKREEVERFASDTIVVFCWLGIVITYLVARRMGFGRPAALATAGLLIASPWLAYSRSFFPEIAIGLILVLGLFAMQANRPALAALAVVAASAMKPSFLIFGAVWACERAWARRPRAAITLAAIILAGGAGIALWNILYAGTLIVPHLAPKGPLLRGLWETLLGEKYGVIRFAPWLLVAAAAARSLLPTRTDDPHHLLIRQIAWPLLPYAYVVATGTAPMYGGNCYGPRYYVCVMPFLALAAALAARTRGRLVRTSLVALALLAASISIPGWVQYGLLWDKSPTASWQAFSTRR